MKKLLGCIASILLVGGAAAQALQAVPIEGLLEGPPTMTAITASSATLAVDTSLEVACVVVYGQDESFGFLALDQDMGGAAHRQHRVVLRGLQPDTSYVYRLQGSGTDGRFYASEVLSFRTAAATAVVAQENLASATRGASVVGVSSNYGGGADDSRWGADNAIDGDPATEWSTGGDGDSGFITVRLAQPLDISGFGFWTRTMGDSAQVSVFEVVSESGEVFGPFEVPGADALYTFPASGRGQVFTFRILESSGGNTGAVELAVYGTMP